MGRHWEECPLSWCFRIVSGLWKTVFCDYSCWNAAVWYYISVFKHILKALDELYFVHWRNQLLWSEYLCLRQVHWLQSQPRCDGGGSGSLSEMIRAWARSRREWDEWPYKEVRESFFAPPAQWGEVGKRAPTQSSCTLISEFQHPELWEIHFCSYKPPVRRILLSQPNGLRYQRNFVKHCVSQTGLKLAKSCLPPVGNSISLN